MNLKCIGGYFDGDTKFVEDYHIVGNLVRFMQPSKFKVDTFTEELAAFREKRVPEHMIIKYDTYRISVINFSKNDQFLFLVKEGWSDKEAILHQFNK